MPRARIIMARAFPTSRRSSLRRSFAALLLSRPARSASSAVRFPGLAARGHQYWASGRAPRRALRLAVPAARVAVRWVPMVGRARREMAEVVALLELLDLRTPRQSEELLARRVAQAPILAIGPATYGVRARGGIGR